ncbi:hypothetical protein ACI3L1_15660 [Deinococcus sp. SM5_A1]|uniref:hypothetical protein n=1 Tax=Deinococcus sp. SM5_A1 TaxID=3379094 RepID=UPI00385D5E76
MARGELDQITNVLDDQQGAVEAKFRSTKALAGTYSQSRAAYLNAKGSASALPAEIGEVSQWQTPTAQAEALLRQSAPLIEAL